MEHSWRVQFVSYARGSGQGKRSSRDRSSQLTEEASADHSLTRSVSGRPDQKDRETFMMARTVVEEHDGRVTVITAIAMEVNAIAFSESRDEVISTTDPDAEKLLYAKAYQAWVDCKIEGTAEDIFETVQEVLDI
jgi:hypothetical protein